uniref:ABC transporter domain-containing protein n=1 Tax=Echinostoma caproni TaxID=27848 RepID=A0A183AJI4_9TREM
LVNLLSVDVNRIMELFMYSFFTWIALVQLILSFYLLWQQLGLATLAGIGLLLLMLLFNAGLMWFLQRFEYAFASQVTKIRKTELRNLLRVTVCWGGAQLFWNMTPFAILASTFAVYTRNILFASSAPFPINGTEAIPNRPSFLNAERIFVSVSLFNLLREPLVALPWSLSVIVMSFVSFRRIGKLFLAPELDQSAIETGPDQKDDEQASAIEFRDAAFSWTDNGPLVLSNLDFSIRRGWLVAVVGTVGSGKSSLLSACLGDLTRRSGTAKLKGTTAYVPQTAWIQQQTLRDNICFGESLGSSPSSRDALTGKREWYDTVIKACALQTDLDRLSAGDKTEIGERGVNLSGGQRQRVSLARAVFQAKVIEALNPVILGRTGWGLNCDVYLMDDPLSAVDSHVGKHLFDQVLGPDGLLKEKTRVVTTNAFHWLQQADWILVLNENGQLVQSGTYHDIAPNTSGHFAEYLKNIEKQLREVKKGK